MTLSTRSRTIMIIVGIFILFTLSANAQIIPQPIVIHEGDLWTWETQNQTNLEPVQLTQWGYNSDLASSADGRFYTYNSLPLSVIQGNFDLDFPITLIPSNIWIYDSFNEDFERIATHVNNDNITFENAITRSPTVWSSNTSQVAWMEAGTINGQIAGQIVIYDALTGTSQVLRDGLNLGFLDGALGIPAPEIHWDAQGIWYTVPSFIEAVNGIRTLLIRVNPLSGNVTEWVYPGNIG